MERLGYGGEGLQSLHPLDADLNLPPELYSHQVRPQHKRLWASLEKRPEEVIDQALGEARSRDPTGRKSWVVLVDGHRSQLKTLVRCLRRSGRAAPTIVLDFIHVSEYVWKAGRALHGEVNPKLEGWVGRAPTEHSARAQWLCGGRNPVAARPVGAWRATHAKRWIAAPTICSRMRGICSMTSTWRRASPLPPVSLRGPAVTWSKIGWR